MQNFFPNSARLFMCASFLMLVHLPSVVMAQSRIISADPAGSGAGGPGSRTIRLKTSSDDSTFRAISSMSQKENSWEQVLKKRHSTPFDDGRGHEFISILNWLKSLDVPILLDESARDDSLTESDIVVLKLPGTPLLDRLQQSLKVNNATLAMFPDHVAIVSMDVAQDPDYFLSEFYPIEYISSGNYQELLEDIKASINPQGWNETNGDAHISYLSVNGQPSLSLYAPYTTHQRLQEYLSNIRRISPVGVGRQLVTSQVIQLPSARAKQRPKKKKGYGIGGFGGGGGMF